MQQQQQQQQRLLRHECVVAVGDAEASSSP
jgi:hypothetical protein